MSFGSDVLEKHVMHEIERAAVTTIEAQIDEVIVVFHQRDGSRRSLLCVIDKDIQPAKNSSNFIDCRINLTALANVTAHR